jgi:hypothetical protein
VLTDVPTAIQNFSHGCALHSCVEILRYEMAHQMTDQWTKWRQEIAEFMEPLATNAGREDFIEGVDGVVHEFPLQLYTHVAMAGRSKKTNYRFQFFLDGPYRKDMKGIEPIEKEFPDRVAQFNQSVNNPDNFCGT